MISKKLYGRTDIEEYGYSAKDMYNMLPAPMGGSFSRPGSVLQKILTGEATVIPWENSVGNFYLVYIPNVSVTASLNFSLFDNDFFQYNLTVSTIQLLNFATSTNLPTHASLISQQSNANAEFQSLDLQQFSFASVEDAILLTHNSKLIPPLVFTFDVTTLSAKIKHYQFSEILPVSSSTGNFFSDTQINLKYKATPYLINKESTTWLLPSVTGTAGTQTTSHVTTNINSFAGNTATPKDYFTADMVHTFFVINQGDKEGVYFITGLTSASQVTAIIVYYGLDNTTKSANFRRQLFAKDLGFPALVSSFNNRILFANTPEKTNWFFASKTNSYGEILGFRLFQDLTAFPITESDSFELPLTSKRYAEIKWISQQNDLLMGTGREEFVVNQGEGALSILDIGISPQSNIGGSFVAPIKTSEAVFIVSSDGKTIRKIQYNFDVRGYRSKNISILNDDLIYKLRDSQVIDSIASIKITKLAWQESARVLWVLTNSNNLFSVTEEPSSQTTAWAYHEFGGSPEVIDIFTQFSNGADRDVLGVVLKRGSDYSLEFVAPEYLNDSLEVESLNIGDQPIFTDMSHLIALEETPVDLELQPGTVSGFVSAVGPTGYAQRFPTGKRFEITASSKVVPADPDDTFYDVGEIVYLINYYDGYGTTVLDFAATLQDALDGIPHVPTTPYNLILEDFEPTATYLKWGSFTYLAGETVDVIADGILTENLVVDANGIVTLPSAASKVVVGYFFGARLETITPEVSTKEGSSQGTLMRAREAYVRYYKSRTGSIGTSESNLEPLVFPEVPFTGALRTTIDSTTDREYSIILKKEKSLPLNVMSITFRGEV